MHSSHANFYFWQLDNTCLKYPVYSIQLSLDNSFCISPSFPTVNPAPVISDSFKETTQQIHNNSCEKIHDQPSLSSFENPIDDINHGPDCYKWYTVSNLICHWHNIPSLKIFKSYKEHRLSLVFFLICIIYFVTCFGTKVTFKSIPIPSASRFNNLRDGFLVPFSNLLISA